MIALPQQQRTKLYAQLTDSEAESILTNWELWARPEQRPDPLGDWTSWVHIAGRGSGKTRSAAEMMRFYAEGAHAERMALVAPTAADVRDVMIEGESGLIAIAPNATRPIYNPSKRLLSWPNGVRAWAYSAEEPNRLRGPQHEIVWGDEVSSWQYEDAYDQLQFGLRLGAHPRGIYTTTPKPNTLTRRIIKEPKTLVTTATTYANAVNLPPSFLAKLRERYENTRLGRQEIYAELLDKIEGALWSTDIIDAGRVSVAPQLSRIVIGVDPAATSGSESDETGIIAAGVAMNGKMQEGYVLEDCSLRATPDQWARRAIMAYDRWQADTIVAEVNNGGEMVTEVVRSAAEKMQAEGVRSSPEVNIRQVHASRGKATRAEPVSAKYEQGLIHHVGFFAKLEEQQVTFTPGSSRADDRMDALVWCMTELLLGPRSKGVLVAW